MIVIAVYLTATDCVAVSFIEIYPVIDVIVCFGVTDDRSGCLNRADSVTGFGYFAVIDYVV